MNEKMARECLCQLEHIVVIITWIETYFILKERIAYYFSFPYFFFGGRFTAQCAIRLWSYKREIRGGNSKDTHNGHKLRRKRQKQRSIWHHKTNDKAMQTQLNNRGKCMCSWRVNTNNIDKTWIPIKQIEVNQISCTCKRGNGGGHHNK
jgi:hypothetical protein